MAEDGSPVVVAPDNLCVNLKHTKKKNSKEYVMYVEITDITLKKCIYTHTAC